MVELNGACSNPFVKGKSPLFELFLLKRRLLERKRRPRKPASVAPRTSVPVIKTITQILELANYQAMSVKDIHEACQELLGRPVSYRSVKASLSEGSHHTGRFVRESWGMYRLGVTSKSS